MGSEHTLNPTGGVLARRTKEEPAPSHLCQRTVGEDPLPGYGSVTLVKRPVRSFPLSLDLVSSF
jgi:hypothetical protein